MSRMRPATSSTFIWARGQSSFSRLDEGGWGTHTHTHKHPPRSGSVCSCTSHAHAEADEHLVAWLGAGQHPCERIESRKKERKNETTHVQMQRLQRPIPAPLRVWRVFDIQPGVQQLNMDSKQSPFNVSCGQIRFVLCEHASPFSLSIVDAHAPQARTHTKVRRTMECHVDTRRHAQPQE
jgi:hypothetical protein